MSNKYKFSGRVETPVISKMRNKYEEMYLFGELDDELKRFKIDDSWLRNLLYSTRKGNQTTINFDNIIKLSHMFEIPYDDFIDYNALIDYNRNIEPEKLKEEEQMLKQYSVGKEWEDRVIKYYSDRGYFTYKIPTMNSGTVFDIIAIKKGSALMIECKHTTEDKLYYAGSGILKKRDELDHFVETTKNNIYIYINSDKTGTWWTTWLKAKPLFEEKGYISKEDCFPCTLDNLKEVE